MADPVAYAQAQIDEWHKRLKAGGSARPSPTIAIAQAAGYERLIVECAGCRQSNQIPLDLIKRPPETLLADLAERLVCKRCGKTGPLPRIAGVSRQLNGFGARGVRAPLPSDGG
jgi:hypothetical protein